VFFHLLAVAPLAQVIKHVLKGYGWILLFYDAENECCRPAAAFRLRINEFHVFIS
jgi:hypothetical protein